MEKKVYGVRCKTCGKLSYPAHCVCPKCGGTEFEPFEVTGEGTVVTFTDVYALAIDYVERYLRLAIVEMDSGVRATGHLVDEAPRTGKRVRATVGVVRCRGGEEIHGLRFLPV
jgi:hypothetical protein